MDTENQKRYHDFMEKYMGMQKIMRHNQRRQQQCNPWLLIGIHSINKGQPVMISQISAKLDISNAAATQMIDHLEKRGLVERFADDNDRRVTMVRLTETGKVSLKASFEQTASFLDGLFKHLGEEDTQHLMRLMDLVMSYTMSNLYTSEEKK